MTITRQATPLQRTGDRPTVTTGATERQRRAKPTALAVGRPALAYMQRQGRSGVVKAWTGRTGLGDVN